MRPGIPDPLLVSGLCDEEHGELGICEDEVVMSSGLI